MIDVNTYYIPATDLSTWFWGLTFFGIFLGIPTYYVFAKMIPALWLNPLETRKSLIVLFIEGFLSAVFGYALAKFIIDIADPFWHSKMYLKIFIEKMMGG